MPEPPSTQSVNDVSEPLLGKKRIFIVDDHPVLRDGLTEMINRSAQTLVCGEASTGEEALERIAQLLPDLVIVDLSLPGMNGIDLVRALRARAPGIRILVLSMHDESLHAERAIRAGARGYIMKHQAGKEIQEAVGTVLKGDLYLSPPMSQQFLESAFQPAGLRGEAPEELLSVRELQVFRMIGEGQGTAQIARQLGLNIKTIETYQARMKEKLRLRDAAHLYQVAHRWVRENEL